MGCGTGVHAVALALLGLEVTGLDVSEGMLDRARVNAAAAGATLDLRQGDFLAEIPRRPVDLLLCLGNSLPHLDGTGSLTSVLRHWRALLKDDGHAIIQLLNYRRVLDSAERIVNVRRDGDVTIVRFYDFLESRLRFNILSIAETPDGMQHALQSTLLTPFTPEEIEAAAREAGFGTVEKFGSLRFAPFTSESTDLVVTMA